MACISIIIPALNEAAGIGLAVERAWKTRPHEVLVADGGSDDGTPDLASQAGARVLMTSRGRGNQQNAAANQAFGDVLLFLHADTWLDPSGCRQIESVLEDPSVQCGAFAQQIEAVGRRYRWLERGNAWRVRRCGMPYGDQGLFLRRSFFDQLGGFPQTLLMEDWLLMRQARRHSWPRLLTGPLHVSARRWERHGVVRQTLRNWSFVAAATVGVSPNRLARYYRLHSEPSQ